MPDTTPMRSMFGVLRAAAQTAADNQDLPIVHLNESQVQPTDRRWIEVMLETEPATQLFPGRRGRFRQEGRLRLRLHGRHRVGDQPVLTKADALLAELHDKALAPDAGRCEMLVGWIEGSLPERHKGQEVGWRVDVVIPFRYDDDWTIDPPANPGSHLLLDREAAANAVRSRFKAQIGDVYMPPTVVIWDNAPTNRPTYVPGAANPGSNAWVRAAIQWGPRTRQGIGVQATIGTDATLVAMIHTPQGFGLLPILPYVDQSLLRFRALNDGGIRYGAPWPAVRGRTEDGYRVDVQIPFSFVEQARAAS